MFCISCFLPLGYGVNLLTKSSWLNYRMFPWYSGMIWRLTFAENACFVSFVGLNPTFQAEGFYEIV